MWNHAASTRAPRRYLAPQLIMRGWKATSGARRHTDQGLIERPPPGIPRLADACVPMSVVDGRIRHMLLTKRTERQEVAADRDDVRARTVPGPTGRCWPTGAPSAWQVTDETQGRGRNPRSKQR